MTDFDALNTATKYPSIETFHRLSAGTLTEELNYTFDGPVSYREKIDGTGVRVILLPGGDYVIGSRNELLYAKGDRLGDRREGIVDHMRAVADKLRLVDDGWIHVLYLEVFGGKIGPAAKQYSAQGATGHRLFDVAFIPPDILGRPVTEISAWRQHDGQVFATNITLQRAAQFHGLSLAPDLGTIDGASLPTTLKGMDEWMRGAFPQMSTHVHLEGHHGAPEGLVLRAPDRSLVVKARFQDYHKALNPQPAKKKRD